MSSPTADVAVGDTESLLLQDYASALGVPLMDAHEGMLEGVTPFEGLSAHFLRTHGFFPLPAFETTGRVPIVAAVPVQMGALDALRQFFNAPVALQLAPRAWVDAAIAQVYGQDAMQALSLDQDGQGDGTGSDDEDLDTLKALAEDAPVVRLVQALLLRAVERRASDLHLEVTQQRFRVRYRIDGVLWDAESPPRRLYLPSISHLKLRAKMNIAERRLPQDGRMKMEVAGRQIDMRVSTVPTVYGESMVIRLLDQGPGLMGLESLGLDAESLAALEAAILQPHGMILVTGPTGSGKTSTLYASLSMVNKADNKIITVEDPVEYQIDGINQIQVKPQIDLTFANALRSIVRQDPDIIMVGEIRDLETAEMAVQAALTGHLVFSTLHTNDAPSAITRLMELGVPPYLLNATILGVLAQRLVRTLCKQCKQKDDTSDREVLMGAVKPWKLSGGYQPYKPVGCVDCRMSGFRGRMGLYELLTVSEALKEKINQAPSIDMLRRQAVQDGMRPLRLAGALRVAEGLTTLEEVLTATPPLE